MPNIFNIKERLERLQAMLSDEQGRQILSHPKLCNLLSDEKFKKAIEEKNYFQILSHPGFVQLTKDTEFQSFVGYFKDKSGGGNRAPA